MTTKSKVFENADWLEGLQRMLTVRSDDFSEKQLAEIALAIQNRWEVPTFVKMHEIVVVDEDIEDRARQELMKHFERGLTTIFGNLELLQAFKIEKQSKTKYVLERIPGSNLPQWTADIETPSRIPEGVYECPHCVLPDTLILGDNKVIVEYKGGDTALGQTGLNTVIHTFARPYSGEMINVKANGLLPITTTPEHPILVSTSRSIRLRQGTKHLSKTSFSNCEWLPAAGLRAKDSKNDGHYVVIPILKGNIETSQISLSPFIKADKSRHKGYNQYLPLNEDVAWLLGLYVAEGSITKELRFSLSKDEERIRRKIDHIARRLGYSTYTQYAKTANSMLVTIPSRVLARAFDYWCGHGAVNKRIPDYVLYHKDNRLVKAFLLGYEIGDGYDATNKLRGNKHYRVCSTVSRILAQQLQLAYARLHIWAGIYRKHKKTKGHIMGRKVSLHPAYLLSYPLQPNVKRQKVRFLDNFVLSPIRNIVRKNHSGSVCNVETTDNTYLVSNAVVHNCGKWFQTDLELSMHTKLHYLI